MASQIEVVPRPMVSSYPKGGVGNIWSKFQGIEVEDVGSHVTGRRNIMAGTSHLNVVVEFPRL